MAHCRNDAILMEILSERRTVTEFLDTIFGFLRRNTDFYYVRQNESERIGFSSGMREKIVYTMMQRHDPAQEQMQQALIEIDNAEPLVPTVEQELELATAEVHEEFDPNKSCNSQTSTELGKTLTNPVTRSAKQVKSEAFNVNDFKNGACYGTYCWAQTFKDFEVHVMLPKHLTRSRLLNVKLEARKITVCNKTNPVEILLEGKLFAACRNADAVWLVSENKLMISIDKARHGWWERLFLHEPSIELSKLDTTEMAVELSEETNANIEKLRYEHLEKEKVNNNPPSENQTNFALERFKAAWNSVDPPFRGEEFNEFDNQFSSNVC